MLRVLPLITAALLFGCQNPDAETVAVHEEEPFTPAYTPPSQTATTYNYDTSGGDSQSLDNLDGAETTSNTSSYVAATPTTSYDEVDSSAAGGRVYEVRKGDTLYQLARQFYNDQARWRDIWNANRNRVPNPDQLYVGTKLIIP
ncbi:MAG: LysM domain-containing protein [Planctomycetota bacterium]|nr:MAG: LysM domain-containing protein [Planctomycetota bacterium]